MAIDQDTFTDIYKRYRPLVYSILSKSVRHADIEDVLQEVMLSVWRSAQVNGYDAEAIGKIIHTACRYKVHEYYRPLNFKNRSAAKETLELFEREHPVDTVTPERTVIARQELEAIGSQVPLALQAPFLKRLQGYYWFEIAEQLRTTRGSLAVRWSRFVASLDSV